MENKDELIKLIKYFSISVFETIFDFSIVYFTKIYLGFSIVTANTLGVVCGSITQYFLTNKFVFNVKAEKKTAIIFFGTAIVALILNNIIIYVANNILINYLSEKLSLLVSKFISIVLPFFVIYFTRRYLYDKFSD